MNVVYIGVHILLMLGVLAVTAALLWSIQAGGAGSRDRLVPACVSVLPRPRRMIRPLVRLLASTPSRAPPVGLAKQPDPRLRVVGVRV
jgi:hypothetical protein